MECVWKSWREKEASDASRSFIMSSAEIKPNTFTETPAASCSQVKVDEDVKPDICTSDVGPSVSADQHYRELQIKTIKKEEDEDYLNGGTSGSEGLIIPIDQQNGGFQKKEELKEEDDHSPQISSESMDCCQSDCGEEVSSDADYDSDAQLLELSTDVEASDASDDEDYSPPRKKTLVTQHDNTPAPRLKATDGTVWERIDVERAPDGESALNVTFSETAGPTEHAKSKVTSRLESFRCLIDVEMLRIITDCTSHEARRADSSWSLSVNELMAFIAILFLRATLCPVGAMVESWSVLYAVPAIKETLSRDRYGEIMQYLCFDDKHTRAEREKTDRFAAISYIWQRFVRNCSLCYKPGQHMTVNEQLFPTKVRCPFLQYIATDKIGIRFWIAADLETKYMCNAIPYLGKDPSRPKGERLHENVITKLMEPFLDKGRTVTTDSFFTSLSLANRLLKCDTALLGAVNTFRREFPPAVKVAKGREEFSTQVYKSGSATLTVYAPKKNKSICILSTMHQRVQITDGRKQKPNTVTDYNHMKRGVDIMDQKARAYTVRAGTRRWPVAVFYNMLDLAAMNAHILYKACTGSTERRRDFVRALADELRSNLLQEKALAKKQRPPPAPGKKTQCQVQTNCHRNHSTERCAVCDRYTCRKCRKDGPWVCSNC